MDETKTKAELLRCCNILVKTNRERAVIFAVLINRNDAIDTLILLETMLGLAIEAKRDSKI